METINLDPLDKKDLLYLLDYAFKKKQEEEPDLKGSKRWDDRAYWKMRIYQIKALVNGYQKQGSYIQSSMLTMQRNTPKKDSIESDIDDLLDYKQENREF